MLTGVQLVPHGLEDVDKRLLRCNTSSVTQLLHDLNDPLDLVVRRAQHVHSMRAIHLQHQPSRIRNQTRVDQDRCVQHGVFILAPLNLMFKSCRVNITGPGQYGQQSKSGFGSESGRRYPLDSELALEYAVASAQWHTMGGTVDLYG